MADPKTSISPELIAEAVKRVMSSLGQTPAYSPAAPTGSTGKLATATDYPLAAKRPDLVQSVSGMKLEDISLDKVVSGRITFDDIKIRAETLEYQAQVAENVHRPRLAANLRRAAEMTRIPDQRLLEMYNALRPYRSTKQELLDIAGELESQYQARICAALFKEAAQIYEKRGRLKP
jgi:propanediol dehydratase small subunit